MTSQDQSIEMLRWLASVRDENLAPLLRSKGARSLFDAIVNEDDAAPPLSDRRQRGLWWHRRRGKVAIRALAGATAAAVGFGVVLGSSVITPGPAVANIQFTTRDGYIVALVTDPEAATEELDGAFAARELDIELELVPVSPSAVGTVTAIGGDQIDGIQTLAGDCATPGGACPIGLRIPVDFDGQAEIQLGREAHPGERYVSAGNAFAPGEVLHCSGLLGASVEQAAEILRGRQLDATWHRDDRTNKIVDAGAVSGYVTAATAVARDQVVLWVDRRPPELDGNSSQAGNRKC